jgi:hypothetical protein
LVLLALRSGLCTLEITRAWDESEVKGEKIQAMQVQLDYAVLALFRVSSGHSGAADPTGGPLSHILGKLPLVPAGDSGTFFSSMHGSKAGCFPLAIVIHL